MKNLNAFVLMTVTQGSQFDMSGKGELLGIAQDGYFASSAWLVSDEEYKGISGRSFGIITGDDDCEYREDKFKMYRPTEQQVLELLPKCSKSFQERAKLYI